ncbi:MAG: phosphomethylpyrimidine synthase ThiC, partial [Deltaproteobacteria bacterium]|nr:phosphomethylpyrimidine synthase ThiC [Deltaproteobacteria bacterium]
TSWDDHFSLLMFPEKAMEVRTSRSPGNSKTCTMCGDFCAMTRGYELFKDDIKGDKIRQPAAS